MDRHQLKLGNQYQQSKYNLRLFLNLKFFQNRKEDQITLIKDLQQYQVQHLNHQRHLPIINLQGKLSNILSCHPLIKVCIIIEHMYFFLKLLILNSKRMTMLKQVPFLLFSNISKHQQQLRNVYLIINFFKVQYHYWLLHIYFLLVLKYKFDQIFINKQRQSIHQILLQWYILHKQQDLYLILNHSKVLLLEFHKQLFKQTTMQLLIILKQALY